MKKYYTFILIFALALVAPILVLGMNGFGPSFEVSPQAGPNICNPESDSCPDIAVDMIGDSLVKVTAEITDISGISQPRSKFTVKSITENKIVATVSLYDDGDIGHGDTVAGDDTYGALIPIDSYPAGIYTVYLFAFDMLDNRTPEDLLSPGIEVGTFSIGGGNATQIDPFIITPSSANVGELVILSATLKKEDGTPLANETISFIDETDNIDIGSAITNISGEAQVTYDLGLTTMGVHRLKASYAGNLVDNLSPSDQIGDLNIAHCDTNGTQTICVDITESQSPP